MDTDLIAASDAAIAKGYAVTVGSNAVGTANARNYAHLGASNADLGESNYGEDYRY